MRKRAYADRALSLPNPSRLLGALPKRSWIKRLRRLGLEVLVPLWRHAASTSEATRSRWQWTWVGIGKLSQKIAHLCSKVRTIEDSLSLSHCVARKIWRRRGVSSRRYRAHRL